MSVTNTWSVVQMDCHPTADDKTDVVFNVHWTLSATDGTHFGSAYGAQELTVNPTYPFTPYDQLTEDQVLGWVKAAMGVDAVAAREASAAQQIADQVNPPVVRPALPWAE